MPDRGELIRGLRNALAAKEELRDNSFAVLRDISTLSGDPDAQEQFQEFVLRALESRSYFSQHADILNSLTKRAGLYPYLDENELSLRDQIAYEYHKPINFEEGFVFHSAQGEVYRRIIEGENIALSAPTSYGKSLIIDAIIARGIFYNIVIVVPTIALIDETRRRLAARFRGVFKVITHPSQKPTDRNIYVLTQERVLEFESLDHVDFFVIDEFYKLDPGRDDNERALLLNQAFYKLHKQTKRFYMLGPSIFGLPPGFQERVDCKFILDPYQTVVTEVHDVAVGKDGIQTLVELCRSLKDSTSIFCRSPKRASDVARALLEAGIGRESGALRQAAEWVSDNYHPEWHFAKALRRGIGVHHGRIPRSLAQYAVRKFNDGLLQFMICTSTLIEGVNTKARNMIIFDNEINRNPIDYFTFNNIKGRSGRMKQHYVGHVFIFHTPPQYELPFVDVPAFNQTNSTPASLLIQLDEEDLAPKSKERVRKFSDQNLLSFDVLRRNFGIDPEPQLNLASDIHSKIDYYHKQLSWSGVPNYRQLSFMCYLIWTYFGGQRFASGSVVTAKQLTFLINRLVGKPTTRELVLDTLRWGKEKDPNEAVQQILDFLRLWAMFHFPRFLRAVNNIQRDVFKRHGLPAGSYESFGGLVENLYMDPAIVALDEYGVPVEIARKLEKLLAADGNLDETLRKLKDLPLTRLRLDTFEQEILSDAMSHI